MINFRTGKWYLCAALLIAIITSPASYANVTEKGGGMNLQPNGNVYIGSGYYLIFQTSGNLVMYNSNNYQTLWSTDLASRSCSSGCNAIFQSDGNLVLYQ